MLARDSAPLLIFCAIGFPGGRASMWSGFTDPFSLSVPLDFPVEDQVCWLGTVHPFSFSVPSDFQVEEQVCGLGTLTLFSLSVPSDFPVEDQVYGLGTVHPLITFYAIRFPGGRPSMCAGNSAPPYHFLRHQIFRWKTKYVGWGQCTPFPLYASLAHCVMLSRDQSDIGKNYIFCIVSSSIPSLLLSEPLQAVLYHLTLSWCTVISEVKS